jgi:hypothetical protein
MIIVVELGIDELVETGSLIASPELVECGCPLKATRKRASWEWTYAFNNSP